MVALVFLAVGVTTAAAAVYRVGPSRPYATLQQVAPLLAPGDVVEVDGDATYPGDVVFTRPGTATQPITVRGVRVNGRRPLISGGTNTVTFATPWPYTGPGADHYLFEGFELTAGSSRCLYHQAAHLVVRDVHIHHCPAHGLLGADQGSGSLLLEYSEIHHCGAGTTRHQIYMATDEANRPGSVFRMRFCYVHSGLGGNNVKSRAERNEIYYNWIEGALYHELELVGPDGADPTLAREDSDLVGNVLLKRNNFYVVRVGGDGTGETRGRYRFINNTILSGSSAVFRVFDGVESIEMSNNVIHRFDGPPTVMRTAEAQWATGTELIAGANNWVRSGAQAVPSQWSATLTGADPGFVDVAGGDLRPAAGSPLLDAGTAAPPSPPGYPFPSPHFPPSWHPPGGAALLPGGAAPRPSAGPLDIGALERDSSSVTPTPSVTRTPTPTATPTRTLTPTPTPTRTPTATPPPNPTATATPSATPRPTPTFSPTPQPRPGRDIRRVVRRP